MKSAFALMVALALSACAAALHEPPADAVRKAESARFRAMTENDLAALSSLLAEDLVYIHTSGEVETKEQFLAHLRSGALRYRSIQPSNVQVRTYGAVAVVTGHSQMAVTSGGTDREFEIMYTAVYRSNGAEWQLASWQSTRITSSR